MNVDVDGEPAVPIDPWDFGTSSQYPVLKYGTLRPADQRGGDDADDGIPGVTTQAANPLVVAEGGTNTYTVVLDTQPTADVTITPSGGGAKIALSPASHTITPNTWNKARTFTVSAPQDADSQGYNLRFRHMVSSQDGRYHNIPVSWVSVSVADDDPAGVTVTAPSPLNVVEGGSNTYTVVLDSQPVVNVTISPASDDVGAATVSPASLTFTPQAWNTPGTFTVSGLADDDSTDETVNISHRVNSQDGSYYNIPVSSVVVSVSDTTPPPAQPVIQTQEPPAEEESQAQQGAGDAPVDQGEGPSDDGGGDNANGEPQPEEQETQPEEEEPQEQQAKDASLALKGTNGADELQGGDANDLIVGRQGDDLLRGKGGNDELRGGKGNDELHGGRGADSLYGGNGDDRLYGDRGADRLFGGQRRRHLHGRRRRRPVRVLFRRDRRQDHHRLRRRQRPDRAADGGVCVGRRSPTSSPGSWRRATATWSTPCRRA